jgi:nucleoside-triphosphatase THEP1
MDIKAHDVKIYITGNKGTGKTTLLNGLKKKFESLNKSSIIFS